MDAAGTETALRSLLASLPSSMHLPYEAYYNTVLYFTCAIIGRPMEIQKQAALGVMDGVIAGSEGELFVVEMKYLANIFCVKNKPAPKLDKHANLSESMFTAVQDYDENHKWNPEQMKTLNCKLDDAAKEAMEQIEEREYYAQFLSSGNRIVKAAIVVHHRSDVRVVFQKVN
jgi:hypothetical protein